MNASSAGACAVCAWREDCKKKFAVSGREMRCPEFVKDLTIKGAENAADIGEGEKGELKS